MDCQNRNQNKQKKHINISLYICMIPAIILFTVAIVVPRIQKLIITIRKEELKNEDWDVARLTKAVLPEQGVLLPIKWSDLSQKLIKNGVIDQEKFEELYKQRNEFDDEAKKMVEADQVSEIAMDENNANLLLNLFWAFGLSNKNKILEDGPMTNPKYEGAEKFASTGGWTLAKGNVMKHYSKYEFITLSIDQQKLIEDMAKNIYRPCCNNSTYFPDCNHGMAMLGLLELMAANGANEEEMYKIALRVNSYWFPGYYPVIARYFETKGVSWDKVDPKEILGEKYSSALGYQKIEAKINPSGRKKGNKCNA